VRACDDVDPQQEHISRLALLLDAWSGHVAAPVRVAAWVLQQKPSRSASQALAPAHRQVSPIAAPDDPFRHLDHTWRVIALATLRSSRSAALGAAAHDRIRPEAAARVATSRAAGIACLRQSDRGAVEAGQACALSNDSRSVGLMLCDEGADSRWA
jgi:hypothetical protein